MGRIRGNRSSPALVISIVALLFAVAGTAVAGVATVSVLSKKEKKQTRNIARDEIKKAAPRISVANANSASTAVSANPEAFARVLSNGTVDAANSKGVAQANVTASATVGIYCFSGLPFQPRGGQVAVDYQGNPTNTPNLEFSLGTIAYCPAGTQAFVYTHSGNTDLAIPFFIVFYR